MVAVARREKVVSIVHFQQSFCLCQCQSFFFHQIRNNCMYWWHRQNTEKYAYPPWLAFAVGGRPPNGHRKKTGATSSTMAFAYILFGSGWRYSSTPYQKFSHSFSIHVYTATAIDWWVKTIFVPSEKRTSFPLYSSKSFLYISWWKKFSFFRQPSLEKPLPLFFLPNYIKQYMSIFSPSSIACS